MLKILTTFCLLSCLTCLHGQTASLAESVEYDPSGNRFLSSNDATSIIEIDTSGNLSYFGSGLPASLGMEIIGNYLICIVATSATAPVQIVRAYDLTTETEVSSITIPGAMVLNGMASDGVSTIWVTDLQGRAIYEVDFSTITAPSYTELVGSSTISNFPNGITHDAVNNRLVFVSWSDSKIRQVNLADNSVSEIFDAPFQNMDGIDMDSDNNFYVSSWAPSSRITKFSNDFSTSEQLLVPGVLNPADLCVAKEINMLAIPSFQHDVILWPLGMDISSGVELMDLGSTRIFPNPTNGPVIFQIDDLVWQTGVCQVFGLDGKMIQQFTLSNDGSNRALVDLNGHPKGTYLISLLLDEQYAISKKVTRN